MTISIIVIKPERVRIILETNYFQSLSCWHRGKEIWDIPNVEPGSEKALIDGQL